ncbi:SDR family oxidoreductase [Vibrio sp. WXL103]|uniref:SDR family oxidoreductase n=1 Tax=unclassified Vibrio TaxID=2614977 RepID=UPI003EC4CB0D
MSKRILITGAGSGFGRGAALQLAKNGHQVIAGVHIPPQKSDLLAEADKLGITLDVMVLDITNEAHRQSAFKQEIDILVNNAGVIEGGPAAEIPLENVRHNYEVNVFGTLAMIQGFVPQMAKRGKGKIVTVTSTVGLMTVPTVSIYASTKHALESLLEGLKVELQDTGIEICSVLPGAYKTGFNDRAEDPMATWFDPQTTTLPQHVMEDVGRLMANQLEPQQQIDDLVRVVEEENSRFRNVCPPEMVPFIKMLQERSWDVKHDEQLWVNPLDAG